MKQRHPAITKLNILAGTETALAKRLGLSPGAVNQWQRVPRRYLEELEAMFPGKITCREMRPDLYQDVE